VRPEDATVILGSGLTAVDAVLSLCQTPRKAPITLISRRGLFPLSHAETPTTPVDLTAMVSALIADPDGVRVRTLLRQLRLKARELNSAGKSWHGVVDGLRPHTARLWQSMSLPERQRFLAQLRPFWEIHRHRMAQAVAKPFQELLATGAVRLLAGSVESANADDESIHVVVRKRGCAELTALKAAWVINCTGPLPSNSVESNPVIGSMLVSGLLRPDELFLGVETTADGKPVDANGENVPGLFLVGTLRKSIDWESTAVPELRVQSAAAAKDVLDWLGS
jgi:uncharacterized NAD(P)/FAD-binding protein YdhS